MKKLTLLLFMLASLTAITACKKDKTTAENPTETTKAQIVGKWYVESGTIVTSNPPNPDKTETLNGKNGKYYFDFRTNGIAFNNLEGDEEAPYQVTGSSSIKIGDNDYTIKTLTANKFVIEAFQSDGKSSTRFTLILNR